MSNELITLTQTEKGIWTDQQSLNDIQQSCVVGGKLSPTELKTYIQIGLATGLNPFLREIWAVKYGNQANIFVGRDGYRKSAQRHPLYDHHVVDAVYSNDNFEKTETGVKHTYNLKDRGKLLGAYCTVKRKNSEQACFVYVDFAEYTTGRALWKDKPATMIKKVAEAQALRMAFQELFAGTYAEEELDQKYVRSQYELEKVVNELKQAEDLETLRLLFKDARRKYPTKNETLLEICMERKEALEQGLH